MATTKKSPARKSAVKPKEKQVAPMASVFATFTAPITADQKKCLREILPRLQSMLIVGVVSTINGNEECAEAVGVLIDALK